MKKIWMSFILVVFVFFLSYPSETMVLADDDRHEDDERKENYNEWEDEDDERMNEYEDWDDEDWNEDWNEDEPYEGDEYDDRENMNNPSQTQAFWNIWLREAIILDNENLPVLNPQEVDILMGNQKQRIYIIPQNGQLLVSAEKIAQQIQADYQFYEQSKILEIHKGDTELIVRSGANAVYENMVKAPMPDKAYFMENSLYLPISVITNAFGYRVSWDQEAECLLLQEIS